MQMSETVENLCLNEYMTELHFDGCRHEIVTVAFDTERCSGGSFLRGEVSVKLKFRCSQCSKIFEHPIRSPFELWANHRIKSMDECVGMEEVPFPPSAGYLDITQSVVMAIRQGSPRLMVCGTSSCVSSAVAGVAGTEGTGWSTQPEETTNAFDCLKDLRQSLE